MMRNEVKKRVIEIASKVFEIPKYEIDENTTYGSIESWDSLNHLNLFLEIEESLGVRFSAEEISKLTSIKKIIDKILERV